MDQYASFVGSTVTHKNGDTFEVVSLGRGNYHRKLTSDILPALARHIQQSGMEVIIKVNGDSMPGFHVTDEWDEGFGETLEDALRYMLASALTSWDSFEGFENY